MNSKKILCYIAMLFASIIPAVNGYQELREPDIIHVEYTSNGVSKTVRMYKSAADELMRNMQANCFQKESDKKYLFLNQENCDYENILFANVLSFYKEIFATTKYDYYEGLAWKNDYLKISVGDARWAGHLSVSVDKTKKIITEMNIIAVRIDGPQNSDL